MDEAIRFGHDDVADYIEEFIHRKKNPMSAASGSNRRSPAGRAPLQVDEGSPSSGFSSESPSPNTREKNPTKSASNDFSLSSLKPLVFGPGASSTSQASPKAIIAGPDSQHNSASGITKPIPIPAGNLGKEMSSKPTQNGVNSGSPSKN